MAGQDLSDDFMSPSELDEGNDELLAQLGADLAEKRDEAIKARKESGVEEIWIACEEAYLAIDDANRHEFAGAKWAKPTSMSGGLTSAAKTDNKNSAAYVRLTSRYVDMGVAKVCDVVLPIDDKAFSMSALPFPDLIKQKEDKTPVVHPETGNTLMRPANEGEAPAAAPMAPPGAPAAPAVPGAPQAAAQVPVTYADLAQVELDKAEEAAEKAEDRIYGWMLECGYAGELRKVMHDSGRIGVGVLKSPTPVIKRVQAVTKEKDGISLTIKETVKPASKWIDPWNFFPHASCGENPDDGDHCFERDFLSATQLKRLKKDQTYLPAQIDKVLKEGPNKCLTTGVNPNQPHNKHRFEAFYFVGTLKRSEVTMTNAVGIDDIPDEIDDIFVIATLINDSVVRCVLNPLQSGKFGYRTMPWSRRAGHWAGVGIAEQVAMPQRMVNAGTRALLNNAGLSAGVQIIMDPLSVVAADGNAAITPNKLWYLTADSTADDVRKVFMCVEIPNLGQQLMGVIEYACKLAEEASNIPLISQGQTGATTPQTFGATELQDSNAHILMRNIAISVDDHITSPVVHDYYEWLLLDPEVPDDEKGQFEINAKGSLAMVEKAIQEMVMPQIGQMSLQPAYRIDPKRWATEFLKGKRLDPRKFEYSQEEQAKMDATPASPPLPLLVEQAKGQNAMQQIQAKTQAELQLAQQEMQTERERLSSGQATPHMAAASAQIEKTKILAESNQAIQQSRAQTELAYAQNEAQMSRDNAAARFAELQMKRELAILDYTSKHNLTIEQTQAELAKTAMQERTKRELASASLQLQADESGRARTHEANLTAAGHAHEQTLQANDLASTHQLAAKQRVHEASSADIANEAETV